MSLPLGKDENVQVSEDFTQNLVLSWLKSDFSLTNKRIMGKTPNTLFGMIPLGSREITYPLKNIASVGVSTKLHLRRLIFGLILVLIGLNLFDSSIFGGLFLTIVGAIPLLNSYTSTMVISNTAGQPVGVQISILEKQKVQDFANKININISDIM
ncbi:hypothetical protein JF544_02680 [Halobacillus kuroshimensis]|uniref:Uncharacterized protein n=1 Tax=Halobacillus kuroshimensis TaxID=302481 RepID=A0ABS3DS21_9BACI|nr:hypothetical protein [Halobacillus kuroshimensis]MBN8234130.1 hypothetical protein [Halobacillus kuroshimensis]